jgi:hypothetical protein
MAPMTNPILVAVAIAASPTDTKGLSPKRMNGPSALSNVPHPNNIKMQIATAVIFQVDTGGCGVVDSLIRAFEFLGDRRIETQRGGTGERKSATAPRLRSV